MGVGRVGLVAAGVMLGLLTAGCGGGSVHAARSSPTSTPTSAPATSPTVGATTTTVDATKAAILAAYRAEWADYDAVDTFPINPLDPRLSLHATGKQLITDRQALTRLSLLGHYDRGAVDLAPVVTDMDGDTATIMDCLFDHSEEVDGRTGVPQEAPNAGHTLDRFSMAEIDGAWYVSDSTIIKSGKLVDTCTPSGA
jgi:hypothetical protein